jgi:sigma-B regulation protein RsbU (phosphoserine phosphatase)
MPSILRKAEIAMTRSIRRKPPQGVVARASFWLGLIFLTLLVLRLVHLWRGAGSTALMILLSMPLSLFLFILLWRWVFRTLLWRVRNRLIVTYLLMGLVPIILFATLAASAAYLFCGQFATFAANSELSREEMHLSSENRAFAFHISRVVATNPQVASLELPELEEAAAAEMIPGSLETSAFVDGRKLTMMSAHTAMPSRQEVPEWASDGKQAQSFHGMVIDDGHLFFRVVDTFMANGHPVTLVSSIPLTEGLIAQMASDLGRVSILQIYSVDEDDDRVTTHQTLSKGEKRDVESVAGGTLPAPASFYDRTVYFSEPNLPVTDWHTGHKMSGIALNVESRPTLLYKRLFASSVQVATFVRDALITIAVLFGLLELFALIMAMGLSRTITKSISDLYAATRAIDAGHLEHRIVVKRRDQLAALSTSFNTMAESLAHLLVQQREKERLQTELAIAQEVQNSLLPQGQIRLPMLEVHGVSKPARSVSGDYYDFLLTGHTQLALALGDISGKGISAALLMASLHSAVRAYRFGDSGPGPELLSGEVNLLAHPALMLERLNRHLFTSTQPEKYATLFLAHYDGANASLTYSTGGQLPPLVLCANGEVKRLDCGGSVVGLLDGMKYEEATIYLTAGDIVIIYSDGVTEPENEFGDFGEDRLLDLVRRNRSQSLEGISATIMQSLRTWIGDQEQPDDITLVLARQL